MTMWKGKGKRSHNSHTTKLAAKMLGDDEHRVAGPLWHMLALGSPPPPPPQTEMSVSEPGDRHEREANRAADAVMSGQTPTPVSPTRLAPQRAPTQTGPLGHGAPLDAATRAFMEPRFGVDLGAVRVHADERAAASSSALGALAYTVATDVVFGEGQYAPSTSAGQRLLAHELAHVVQQSGGQRRVAPRGRQEMVPGFQASHAARGLSATPRPLIQRKKISHRTLTWADFTGKAPKAGGYDALTASGWTGPNISGATSSKLVAYADGACQVKVGKKMVPGTKYTVKIPVDTTKLLVSSFMQQGKSWHRSWVTNKKARIARCKVEFVPGCTKSLKKAEKRNRAQAAKLAKACKTAWKKGTASWGLTIGKQKIMATSVAECTTKLQPAVTKALNQSLSWQATMAGAKVQVRTSAECKTKLPKSCAKVLMGAAAKHLLVHEQGHFDITNVLAGHANKALGKLAGGFGKSVSHCQPNTWKKAAKGAKISKAQAQAMKTAAKMGKAKALVAASKQVAQQRKQLNKEFARWSKKLAAVQKRYDKQTKHGVVMKQQQIWLKNIAKGLP